MSLEMFWETSVVRNLKSASFRSKKAWLIDLQSRNQKSSSPHREKINLFGAMLKMAVKQNSLFVCFWIRTKANGEWWNSTKSETNSRRKNKNLCQRINSSELNLSSLLSKIKQYQNRSQLRKALKKTSINRPSKMAKKKKRSQHWIIPLNN